MAAACTLSLLPTAAAALTCGDVLTADTTLVEDLVCPASFSGPVLTLQADNITLDGAGFSISASSTPGTHTTRLITGTGLTGVTIENLTIDWPHAASDHHGGVRGLLERRARSRHLRRHRHVPSR